MASCQAFSCTGISMSSPQKEWAGPDDPFGGVEADGCLWGRGAVDMKDVIAMMLAIELSLAEDGNAL